MIERWAREELTGKKHNAIWRLCCTLLKCVSLPVIPNGPKSVVTWGRIDTRVIVTGYKEDPGGACQKPFRGSIQSQGLFKGNIFLRLGTSPGPRPLTFSKHPDSCALKNTVHAPASWILRRRSRWTGTESYKNSSAGITKSLAAVKDIFNAQKAELEQAMNCSGYAFCPSRKIMAFQKAKTSASPSVVLEQGSMRVALLEDLILIFAVWVDFRGKSLDESWLRIGTELPVILEAS